MICKLKDFLRNISGLGVCKKRGEDSQYRDFTKKQETSFVLLRRMWIKKMKYIYDILKKFMEFDEEKKTLPMTLDKNQ